MRLFKAFQRLPAATGPLNGVVCGVENAAGTGG
jgi:hypothetical protein